MAVGTRRLQPEERLIVTQLLCQEPVAEDVAVVSRHAEHRRTRASRLQRHDPPLLLGERLGGAEKLHDIGLALA